MKTWICPTSIKLPKETHVQMLFLPHLKFVNDGDKVYMCLYDLHKAYDSVEYSILLKILFFETGINSKCWRLIKAWYHQPKCKVKVDGRTTSSFVIERGVRQGSVLSPALFLIVMNPHATTPVRGNSTWLVCRGICTCK